MIGPVRVRKFAGGGSKRDVSSLENEQRGVVGRSDGAELP